MHARGDGGGAQCDVASGSRRDAAAWACAVCARCCAERGSVARVCSVGGALIDGSPLLRPLATVKADRIDFALPSGARTAIRAMPANSRSVRGMSASLIVIDEMAHMSDTAGPASDERMFAALEPSTRVFRDVAKVLIISTPFGETGKFHELFVAAEIGLLPSASAVQAPVWEVDTSLDEAWLDARLAELGEDVFRQEHGAEFVAGGGQFFDLRGVAFEERRRGRRMAATGRWAWIRRSTAIGSAWRS